MCVDPRSNEEVTSPLRNEAALSVYLVGFKVPDDPHASLGSFEASGGKCTAPGGGFTVTRLSSERRQSRARSWGGLENVPVRDVHVAAQMTGLESWRAFGVNRIGLSPDCVGKLSRSVGRVGPPTPFLDARYALNQHHRPLYRVMSRFPRLPAPAGVIGPQSRTAPRLWKSSKPELVT